MAEFIVDYDEGGWSLDKERIVRCRDCKWYEERELFGYVHKQCRRTCWSDNTDRYTDVKPDGFCAWGERKVVE